MTLACLDISSKKRCLYRLFIYHFKAHTISNKLVLKISAQKKGGKSYDSYKYVFKFFCGLRYSPPLKVLIKQQSEDGSLTELRRKGKRGIDGYMLDEGVLVHMKLADPGRQWTRVDVPTCRRKVVLDVGHRGLAGGHFFPQ